MTETRKLAAILVADIVGYSRLTGADEELTLARLRTLRSDLIDPTIAIHNGRVIKRTGDGAFVEFRSVVEAVRCAMEVRSGLAERNAGLPADKRIEARVGIHLGDVVEESDGDLMGDGVNVAARLEGICEPDCVCLSAAAYEQVRDKLHVTFVDLGEKSLKNIERPVRAYMLRAAEDGAAGRQAATPASRLRLNALQWAAIAVAFLAVLIAAGWFGPRVFAPSPPPSPPVASTPDRLASAPRLSIVVLPFANLSADPEQDYFADGLSDDLTTDLSNLLNLPDSLVIAHTTALTYKGKAVDAKEIGRELGVRYAVEGSVRRVGETITVNVQLISTETGAHVWADRFEGDRGKLGEWQVEAVARIANALGVQLLQAENLRAMRERPTNPDAVDLTMRGWTTLFKSISPGNVNQAIGYFDQALGLDPGSSLKGVGKTDFWVGLGSDRLGSTVSRGDARHRSFPVGPWVEVAVDGDVQRVCGREWSARFVRGFSAWEPVRLRGVRRRGLCGSRHEGRDVAASGLLPASHAVARSCAASDLSEVRGAQGRYAVGSGGFRVHVVVRGLRAGAGQGDADRQCGQAVGRARHALVADRRALRVARGGGAGFV